LVPGNSDLTALSDASPETSDLAQFWGWGKRYAQRLLGNEAESEDVVQEACCRLVAKGRGGEWNRPRDERAAIFARIIRNLCIDRLRRAKFCCNMASVEWISVEPSAERQVIANETRDRLIDALGRLPDSWREALLLRTSGLNYEEIAQAMSRTKAQIRTWIFRGRRQLESELRREEQA
jgi:RNA polymerase sigma-70 factor (ECF subfamily)